MVQSQLAYVGASHKAFKIAARAHVLCTPTIASNSNWKTSGGDSAFAPDVPGKITYQLWPEELLLREKPGAFPLSPDEGVMALDLAPSPQFPL